jgi:opacity protein-like surface antigen
MSIRAQRGCLAVLVSLLLSWPLSGHAEPYAGLFVGGAFSQNADLDSRLFAGEFRDVRLDTSLVVGGKVGFFFEPPVLGGNVGLELEVYHYRPDIDQQTVTFAVNGFSGPVQLRRSDVQVTPIALNALYRFPLMRSPEFPRGRLHPYGGVGLGAFIANLESRTTILDVNTKFDDSDVQPGFQAIAGVRYFVTPRLALFGEYKYVRTGKFDFQLISDPGTIGGTPGVTIRNTRFHLDTHLLQAGAAFHW